MKILKFMDRIPGGIILTPMLCTAVINTFCPELLRVGGITTKLFSTYGTQVFIGALLFLAGSQFPVKDAPAALKRGGVLLLGKLLLAVALTLGFSFLFGEEGIMGISVAAFCVAMVSLNPGVFLAVASKYGDRIDLPGFGLFNLMVVPTVPLLILGALDGAAFDYMSVVTALVPFFLGMLLGNLDPELKSLFAGGTRPTLFFAGCNFGAAVDLLAVVRTGLSGIVLSLAYILFSGFGLLLVDKLLMKQKGYAAASLSCVAGASVSMPAIVAEALPRYGPYVETATAQIACCVVITTVFSCFFTKWILKKA